MSLTSRTWKAPCFALAGGASGSFGSKVVRRSPPAPWMSGSIQSRFVALRGLTTRALRGLPGILVTVLDVAVGWRWILCTRSRPSWEVPHISQTSGSEELISLSDPQPWHAKSTRRLLGWSADFPWSTSPSCPVPHSSHTRVHRESISFGEPVMFSRGGVE